MYFQITLKHLYNTCIYSSALNPQHSPHVFYRLGRKHLTLSLVSGPLRFLCDQCQILAHIAGRKLGLRQPALPFLVRSGVLRIKSLLFAET